MAMPVIYRHGGINIAGVQVATCTGDRGRGGRERDPAGGGHAGARDRPGVDRQAQDLAVDLDGRVSRDHIQGTAFEVRFEQSCFGLRSREPNQAQLVGVDTVYCRRKVSCDDQHFHAEVIHLGYSCEAGASEQQAEQVQEDECEHKEGGEKEPKCTPGLFFSSENFLEGIGGGKCDQGNASPTV